LTQLKFKINYPLNNDVCCGHCTVILKFPQMGSSTKKKKEK